MSLVRINWNPDKDELRKFGLTVSVGCGVIGLALFFIKQAALAAFVAYGLGIIAGMAGLIGGWVGCGVYRVWMGLAFVMGNIMSRLLLGIFYYGLITPLGLLMRRNLRRELRIARMERGSYWIDIPPHSTTENHERQF